MFKKKDPYLLVKFCNLNQKNDNDVDILDIKGTIFSELQVTSYDDVQLQNENSVNKNRNRKFLVQCSQRICIFNPDGMILSPNNQWESFNNYPVLVNSLISIEQSQNIDYQLVDYSPQTINTQIQSSGTTGSSDGTTNGNSISNTVGSSTSQTNSFGASVSIGNMWGVSGSYENSSTKTTDNSNTSGSEKSNSRSNEASSSAEMSIKDWGAYAIVNPSTKAIAWNFGQEYPWSAVECRRIIADAKINDRNQVQLIIPKAMLNRLYDGVALYPPSQLSMFGVNFVMKALWLVTILDDSSDEITIEQSINYFTGSHSITQEKKDAPSVEVYIDKQPTRLKVDSNDSLQTKIDLGLMALDPIGTESNSAIIGFIPNKFIRLPVPANAGKQPINFKIRSGSNDLMIKDSTHYPSACNAGVGFSPSETAISANFAQNCNELEMTLYFKVIDTISNYTLFMKHWKTKAVGVILTFVINGDTKNPITKYVDALEAEGGENNLLSFSLRNQDFASIDYSDFLQLGLNSIQISIKPIGGQFTTDCGYQIRAISIEKV